MIGNDDAIIKVNKQRTDDVLCSHGNGLTAKLLSGKDVKMTLKKGYINNFGQRKNLFGEDGWIGITSDKKIRENKLN